MDKIDRIYKQYDKYKDDVEGLEFLLEYHMRMVEAIDSKINHANEFIEWVDEHDHIDIDSRYEDPFENVDENAKERMFKMSSIQNGELSGFARGDYDARMIMQEDKDGKPMYIVLKDSMVTKEPTKKVPKGVRNDRKRYGSLINEYSRLTRDVVFSSSSGASGFVMYSSGNGFDDWIEVDTGITLGRIID